MSDASPFGIEEAVIYCPYCGERITMLIDTSAVADGSDGYIEDCQVCCRPIRMQISMAANGAVEVRAFHENES